MTKQLLQSVASSKAAQPILANILISAKEQIEMAATDLEIGIRILVDGEIVEPGVITVPARKMAEIVRELPLSSIKLSTSDNDRIELEYHHGVITVIGLSAEEFPSLLTMPNDNRTLWQKKQLEGQSMFDALIDEIAKLHHQIHEHEPMPADEWERQAAYIFNGTQRLLLELINEHVGLRTLEFGLLYNWLRLATLNRGYDENHFSTFAGNLEMVMKRLVTELKALEAELDDEGPTAEMAEIGMKIQQLRDLFGHIDDTNLPRHQIERQTAQTMEDPGRHCGRNHLLSAVQL